MRKLFKWTGLALGAVVCLAVGVGLFLATPPGGRFLKGIVEAKAEAALGIAVQIESLSTNVVSCVTVYGITAGEAEAAEPLATIDTVRVAYSLLSLLGGRLHLDMVRVQGVSAHISRDSSGQLGVPSFIADTSAGGTADRAGSAVVIDSILVTDLAVRYWDDQTQIDARFSGQQIAVSGIGRSTFTYALSGGSIDARLDEAVFPTVALALYGVGNADELRVDSLGMVCAELVITASGAISLADSTGIEIDLAAHGDPTEVVDAASQYAGLAPVKTSGDFQSSITIQGTTDSPAVALTLTLSRVEMSDTEILHPTLICSLEGNLLSIDTMKAGVFGGRIGGSALVVLDSLRQSQARVQLVDLDLRRMMEAIRPESSPYSGRFSGDIDIAAIDTTFVGLKLKASLQGTNLMYLDKALPDLTGSVTADSGMLEMAIDQDDLAVTAAVRLPGDSLSGSFTAYIPDLSRYGALANLPTLTGEIYAKGTMGGLRANPHASVELSGKDVSFQNIPIDTIAADLAWIDSTLQIGRAIARSALTEIDPLYPPFDLDTLEGRYGFAIDLHGSLDSLIGTASVQLREFTYSGYRVDSADLNFTAAGRSITLDTSRVVSDSLAIVVAGRIDLGDSSGVVSADVFQQAVVDSASDGGAIIDRYLGHAEAAFAFHPDGAMDLMLVGREIEIAPLAALADRPMPISGTVNMAAALRGNLNSPHGTIRLSIEQPDYKGVSLDSLVALLVLTPTRLRLDTLQTYGGGQNLFATTIVTLGRDSSGGIVVSEDGLFAGKVLADSLDLVLLEPLLPAGMQINGRATMDVTWRGTVRKPGAEGTLGLQAVHFVAREGLDSIADFNVVLSSVDTDLRIDTAYGQFNSMPFAVAGTFEFVPWTSLRTDLRFVSEGLGLLLARGEIATDHIDLLVQIDTLALGIFEPFVPMIDTLHGTLSCDITITGSPDDPEITGTLLSRNLTIKAAVMDSTVHDGLLKVSFNRTEAVIDSIYATLGQGFVLVSGRLGYDHSEITLIDLALTARRLPLSASEYGWMTIDSSVLQYGSTEDGFLLAGRIDLGESRLTKDFDAERILPWTKEVEATPSDWPEFVRKTALDLQIRENNRLWIDNNLAKVSMRAGVGVIGTGARPNLSGQVTVDEGYVLYLDRKFTVTQGTALMSHPNRINPDITLEAETKVTNYQGITPTTYLIFFSAIGPMDQLQYSLTSDPPLDQANIVSLLTLGALRDQLVKGGGEGGSGAGAVLTARAARLTSERLAGIASRQVESALGLEEFTVQGNLFDPSENGGPQLLASKRLSDRVKLTYLTTVGNANDQTVRVDYRLTDHFSFEGQTNREGQAVLNIKYGLRFK